MDKMKKEFVCKNCFSKFFIKFHSNAGKFCSLQCFRNIPDEKRYKVNIKTGCWDYAMSLRDGYGAYKKINGKNISAHRYFYEKYKGKIAKGLQLDHLCRNTKCVNPEHLEAVSCAVNVQRGKNVKLNKEKVEEIRKLYFSKKKNQKELGAMYSIDQSTISGIVNNKIWKIQN